MNQEIIDQMAEFTFVSKYAKYDEKKKRRENWDETVSRVEKMHLKKFSKLSNEDKALIKKAFDLVRERRVTPSMRSMQFGGKAIEFHNTRIFNCAVRHIDSIRSFAESFYTLLCGTGIGFGLTDKFLSRLPDLVNSSDKNGTVITYVVQDSIEGWSDSIEALLNCYFKNTAYSGRKIVFDYSKIRPKGAKLKTGGGKAPGYKGLKNCHTKVKTLLDKIIEEESQKRLKTVNAYDVLMHCADAVLSGGIRRSACSCIFDAQDIDMMNAKTGDWFNKNPQRARSNNSAIIVRGKTSYEEFCKLIEKTKEFGEPGFLYVVDDKQLLNPCQPGWAPILTKSGLRQMKDISEDDEIWSETGWTKVVKKWSTGVKKVYKYTTTAGSFYGTENHKLVSNGVKIEAKDCESIDILTGEYSASLNIDAQDILDGLVIGDGTVHEASGSLVLLCIGQDDQDYFSSEISSFIKKPRPGISPYCYEINTTIHNIELPKTYERTIPDRFIYSNRSKIVGFLRGLYSANGSICASRVTLKSASLTLIQQVQLMLSSIGIKSYYTTNKPSMVKFSNGDYHCKQSYDLNITSDREKFANLIGFIQKYKTEKLESIINKTKEGKGKNNYDIISVDLISEEEVFDITVDNKAHTYWTGGVNVSNCFEIGFIPITKDGRCGFQFCNLTSINGAKNDSLEKFKEATWAASLIGTLQAAYTSFPYLGNASEELTQEEALLGVSITGMMDNPDIYFNAEYQRECALISVKTNEEWSKKIGINKAARINCIKPEGTNSIVLSSASGIHPHHARKYFRRIQVNKEDNIYKYFKAINPHACEESIWSANKVDDVISFPITISNKAIIKEDLNAIKHLELIKLTQQNWVNFGTTSVNFKPLNHSVSCTVVVKDEEWKEVTKYLFDNQEYFTAVSLLPYSGDKIYKQAPMEAVVTEEDEAKFNKLKQEWEKVDFSKLIEEDDETSHTSEVACSGGQCDIVKM